MYVDGKQVDQDSSPQQASAAREDDDFTDFVLGSAYGRSNSGGDVTMFVDDFAFMPAFKSEDDVQEAGLIRFTMPQSFAYVNHQYISLIFSLNLSTYTP